MKPCVIFSAGSFSPKTLERLDFRLEDSFVIAADGGLCYCKTCGIMPDLIIGDFDSLENSDKILALYSGTEIKSYPKQKDDTDTLLAIKEALDRGNREIYILGGLGGSLDHTVANLQALSYIARSGARGYLLDDKTFAVAISSGESIELKAADDYLSLFSLSDSCEGVTISGAEYPLENGTLKNSFPLGVSNRITEDRAKISIGTGTLLIMLCHRD